MNNASYSAFLILLAAMDRTLSYSRYMIRIELESKEDVNRAVIECINKDIGFKVQGHFLTLYRG